MAIDFDALALAPCIAAFGEAVAYAPQNGDPCSVSGVFDAAHTEVTVQEGATVSTVQPMLGVRLVDFPAGGAPTQGDQLTARGTLYTVVDVEPDGQGGANLVLMEATDEP